MLGVARALREIHNAGFLHLDIKPNNVLIRENGTPVLIDFGISERIVAARYLDGQNFVMASPYFMSPEQARGEPLDERSDIFSFGALWYRVFTGRTHFQDRTFIDIQTEQKDGAIPKLGPALQHYQPIIDGTLASSPGDRFPNADVLIEKIESYAGFATGVHKIGRQFLGYRSGDSIAHHTIPLLPVIGAV
jgi:serine/threonine-protein kinase PpkA